MALGCYGGDQFPLCFFGHLLLDVLACVIGVGYGSVPEIWTVAFPCAVSESSNSVSPTIRTGRTHRTLKVFILIHLWTDLLVGLPSAEGLHLVQARGRTEHQHTPWPLCTPHHSSCTSLPLGALPHRQTLFVCQV